MPAFSARPRRHRSAPSAPSCSASLGAPADVSLAAACNRKHRRDLRHVVRDRVRRQPVFVFHGADAAADGCWPRARTRSIFPASAVMTLVIVAYIVFGCFLEGIGMLLITVPVFLPLIKQFGYDPVWFGIIVVIVVEVGLIHPPVGLNLFVIQAQCAGHEDHGSIYRGIVPFLFAPLILIVLMFLFPAARAVAAEGVVRVTGHDRTSTSSSLPADRGPTDWRRTDPSPTPSGAADCRGARAAARNSRAPRPSSGRARRTTR